MTTDNNTLRDSYADVIDGVAFDGLLESDLASVSVDVLTQVRQAVCITDADLDLPGPRIQFVNPAYLDVFACEESEVIGSSPRFAQGPLTSRPVLDRIRRHLEAGESIRAQAINYRIDRTPFRLRWSIDPISRDGRIVRFVAIMADVTIEDRMRRRLAGLDALLLAARTMTGEPSSRAATALAAAVVPLLAEVAHGTVTIGDTTVGAGQSQIDASEPSVVRVGDIGQIDVVAHVDAGRLLDLTGLEELARHAAWLFAE